MTISTTSSAGSTIATTLGVGSGLDIASLVTNLAAAQKAPKEALIAARETANKAKVSSLATIASRVDAFASALGSLIGGGTLFTQPTSSSEATLTASAIAGTRLSSTMSATVTVSQLAQGQSLNSAPVSDATAAIGTGTLTLAVGGQSAQITMTADNNSLAGLASAISGAGIGLSASVVSDGQGQRLVVKGATGAASAFTIAAGADATAGLAAYTYDPNASGGLTRVQEPKDARLTMDGVTVTRPSNTVSDLLPGVKLQLKAISTTPVTIGATPPVSAIRSAVTDFVDAFNEVKSTLDEATASSLDGGTAGPFTTDGTVRTVVRQLGALTAAPLVSTGAITSLADLGVATGTDGKLTVNTAKLDAALASDPDGVAALFNPVQSASDSKLQIKSATGAAAPGKYTFTNLVAGPPPSGKVNGQDMIVAGNRLVAPAKSGAGGLVIALTGDVASATVTVEPGLGGALKSVRDGLRATGGPLATLSDSLTKQATAIAADRTRMETRATAYETQIKTAFTAMNTRVTAFKATQSYLEQQIKLWTKDSD